MAEVAEGQQTVGVTGYSDGTVRVSIAEVGLTIPAEVACRLRDALIMALRPRRDD